ncbi:PIN domain-containing protein [Calderihabitans maritimus]|uniref:Twitching motility protein PilT n=1 Tax=Calderihabitans maritimus TaxID=1246530 RepID=A0A1Z5HN58_9FIRM|nr:PIN domain-containing protein [Calderihabitans maritimus]GAW90956.1 twitching motility protein PilT [Calderihabitans maritimus]
MIAFINADGIQAENSDLAIRALQDMAEKNVDFIDAYLAAVARSHEERVCSFDNDFEKLNVSCVKPSGYRNE